MRGISVLVWASAAMDKKANRMNFTILFPLRTSTLTNLQDQKLIEPCELGQASPIASILEGAFLQASYGKSILGRLPLHAIDYQHRNGSLLQLQLQSQLLTNGIGKRDRAIWIRRAGAGLG